MANMPSKPALPGANLGVTELEALVEATRAIAEVLDIETVLELIVESVRNLVRADYAALSADMRAVAQSLQAGVPTDSTPYRDLAATLRTLADDLIRDCAPGTGRVGDVAVHAPTL